MTNEKKFLAVKNPLKCISHHYSLSQLCSAFQFKNVPFWLMLAYII